MTNFSGEEKPTSPIFDLIKDKSTVNLSKQEQKDLVGWFYKYAKKWRVDPLLAACIAATESNFKARPPYLKYCRTKIVGGSAVEVCKRRRAGRREEGMMQSIPRLKVTKMGYWLCTGKQLSLKELHNRRKSICVGMYEMTSRKWWVTKNKWIRPRNNRHRKFLLRLKKLYPHIYKDLRTKFWVAGTYNWGPKILKRNRRRFDNIGYPIRIMRCYLKYWRRSGLAKRHNKRGNKRTTTAGQGRGSHLVGSAL
jgi:hypothetical protein